MLSSKRYTADAQQQTLSDRRSEADAQHQMLSSRRSAANAKQQTLSNKCSAADASFITKHSVTDAQKHTLSSRRSAEDAQKQMPRIWKSTLFISVYFVGMIYHPCQPLKLIFFWWRKKDVWMREICEKCSKAKVCV